METGRREKREKGGEGRSDKKNKGNGRRKKTERERYRKNI